jgi:hypothetical protein
MLAIEMGLVLHVLCRGANQLRSWAAFVVSLQRHGDICSTRVLTRSHRTLAIRRGLTGRKVGFEYWPLACSEPK